jgi:hypothetical protein
VGKKTIYVRVEDQDLWQRAEAYAKARRLPMSGLIMTALEKYLQEIQSAREGARGSTTRNE